VGVKGGGWCVSEGWRVWRVEEWVGGDKREIEQEERAKTVKKDKGQIKKKEKKKREKERKITKQVKQRRA
jgi:hypothetical protein